MNNEGMSALSPGSMCFVLLQAIAVPGVWAHALLSWHWQACFRIAISASKTVAYPKGPSACRAAADTEMHCVALVEKGVGQENTLMYQDSNFIK